MLWLASILGAPVALVQTATVPRLPSGPSSDQYTPPLPRDLDTRRRDWMNPQPLGMPIPSHVENWKRWEEAESESSRSSMIESVPSGIHRGAIILGGKNSDGNYFRDSDTAERGGQRVRGGEWNKEEIAFDALTSSELDEVEKPGDWNNDRPDDDMQHDGFLVDDTFEDQGPGSVEVYKLDLNRDSAILRRGPQYRNKSKAPKKVMVHPEVFKAKIDEDSKLGSKVGGEPRSRQYLEQKPTKERLFGVGGVPELQVGCEGIEASHRQRRSPAAEEKKTIEHPTSNSPLVDFDLDYYSDEDSAEILEEDLLHDLLPKPTTATPAPSKKISRGDMDPLSGPFGEKRKRPDKLPTRGDLGTANNANASTTTVELARRARALPPGSATGVSDRSHAPEGENNSRRPLSVVETSKNSRKKRGTVVVSRNLESDREEWAQSGPVSASAGPVSAEPNESSNKNSKRDVNDENERKLQEYIRRNTPIQILSRDRTQYGATSGSDRDRAGAAPRGVAFQNYDTGLSNEIPRINSWDRVPPSAGRVRPWQDQFRRIAASNDELLRALQLEAEIRSGTEERRRGEILAELRRDFAQPAPSDLKTNTEDRETFKDSRRPDQRRFEDQLRTRGHGMKPSVSSTLSLSEIERLKNLPPAAQIIIATTPVRFGSRFGGDIDFPGLNPNGNGIKVSTFPAPVTPRAPVRGPSACTWAITSCCFGKKHRSMCFESMGCPGGFWDNDPCSPSKIKAALNEVEKYYSL